jgi:hypothetical protein
MVVSIRIQFREIGKREDLASARQKSGDILPGKVSLRQDESTCQFRKKEKGDCRKSRKVSRQQTLSI